jgi:hypothetical protein
VGKDARIPLVEYLPGFVNDIEWFPQAIGTGVYVLA